MEIGKMVYVNKRLSKDQERFITFYKKDKDEACAYMRASLGGKLTNIYNCIAETDNSIMLMQKTCRIGVSKTNRMYDTDRINSAIIISKVGKGLFLKTPRGISRLCLTTKGWNGLFQIPDGDKECVIDAWFKSFGDQFYFLKPYVAAGTIEHAKFPYSMLKKAGVRNLRGYFRYMYQHLPVKWVMANFSKFTGKPGWRTTSPSNLYLLNKQMSIVQNLSDENIERCMANELFRDLCRMSEALQAPVNANWSDRRIKEEHDIVSKKLTAIIAKYDDRQLKIDTKYLPEVPESWELITSNGRLVYEGSMMKHCVGTYGSSVDSGRCLIYSTLLKGERYTIQVDRRERDKKILFTIGQAKGFANKNAPDEILTTKIPPIELKEEDATEFNIVYAGDGELVGNDVDVYPF